MSYEIISLIVVFGLMFACLLYVTYQLVRIRLNYLDLLKDNQEIKDMYKKVQSELKKRFNVRLEDIKNTRDVYK